MMLVLITVSSLHHIRLGHSELAVTSEQAWCLQTKPDVCKADGGVAAVVAAIQDPMQWAVALCTHCGTVSTLHTKWPAIGFKAWQNILKGFWGLGERQRKGGGRAGGLVGPWTELCCNRAVSHC